MSGGQCKTVYLKVGWSASVSGGHWRPIEISDVRSGKISEMTSAVGPPQVEVSRGQQRSTGIFFVFFLWSNRHQ